MNLKQLQVVVVEDEKEAREKLIERLNEEREIEVCGYGESINKSLYEIERCRPDAIFMDIQIKGGDAYHLIDRMLQKQLPVPPIILNTGYSAVSYTHLTLPTTPYV